MAYLVEPDSEYCAALGISTLGHIPGIWSKNWTPEVDAMDYLIAKGTGRWVTGQERSSYGAQVPLAANSMLAFGHDLANFFSWCERRRVSWQELSYGQLVLDYQGDMTSGRWALLNKGRSLSASTINRRMLTAIDFLNFASQRGRRGPFEAEFRDVRYTSTSGHQATGAQRVGKVRQNPKELRLPSLCEIKAWLIDIRATFGKTPYLLAKSEIAIGLRPEEVLLLRRDQVPTLPSTMVGTVRMTICYGTKGGRNPNDPEKRGKPRDVRVPVDLLMEWDGYITGHRKLCLRKFQALNPGQPAPRELFLSKYTGRPLGYDRFREIWKSPKSLPFLGFTPHTARHVWACYTLAEKIREEHTLAAGAVGPISTLAANLNQNLIRTWITTQLGHIDQRTSETYVQWLTDYFGAASYIESWWDSLNEQI
jgi:integrase